MSIYLVVTTRIDLVRQVHCQSGQSEELIVIIYTLAAPLAIGADAYYTQPSYAGATSFSPLLLLFFALSGSVRASASIASAVRSPTIFVESILAC